MLSEIVISSSKGLLEKNSERGNASFLSFMVLSDNLNSGASCV